MTYYVYSHTNKKNNQIFYIGYGGLRRAGTFNRGKREIYYRDYIKEHELSEKTIYVTILFETEILEEALKVEDQYIIKHRESIINIETRAERVERTRRQSTTPENLIRISLLAKANNEKRQRKIQCVSDGKKFDSIRKAAQFYGCQESEIGRVAAGHRMQHKGRVFKFI